MILPLIAMLFSFLAACGADHTGPQPTVMAQLEAEMPRILASVDASLYATSGDATIFNGLLSGDFPWACENLKASQFDDGSFARSPDHKARDDRDFSRDGALGILSGISTGCLDSTATKRFVSFINSHNGCLSTKCDGKVDTSGSFRAVIQEVSSIPVEGAYPIPPGWIPRFQRYFQTGSDEFLSYLSIFLIGKTTAVQNVNSPFQNIVAGDKEKAAELLLKYVLAFKKQECYHGDCGYLRFSSQWENWEAPRAEELYWLYKLIGGK